jgi:hypothetical protein
MFLFSYDIAVMLALRNEHTQYQHYNPAKNDKIEHNFSCNIFSRKSSLPRPKKYDTQYLFCDIQYLFCEKRVSILRKTGLSTKKIAAL